jgi:hypothetical protein
MQRMSLIPGCIVFALGLANGNCSNAERPLPFGAELFSPGWIDSQNNVAIGDFNRDGLMDVVSGFSFGQSIAIRVSRGDGTFETPLECPVGRSPDALAVGDLNGDGRLDLIVCNYGNPFGVLGGVSVLLGREDGTFSEPAAYSLPFDLGCRSVTVADVNGDGLLDVIVGATETPAGINVLLGNGDGTLRPAQSFATSSQPIAIATGDFDGDKRIDLVTANGDSGTVSVFFGKGDGTFRAGPEQIVSSNLTSIAVGDFNRDRKLDIAVSAGVVYSSVSTNGLFVLLGKGDGTFQPAVPYVTIPGASSVAIGDFNGDSKADLAVAGIADSNFGSPLGGISVFLGKGDGTFRSQQTVGRDAIGVFVADLNRDGKADLITAMPQAFSGFGVLLGKGDGSFLMPRTFEPEFGTLAGATGDFDGDRRLDLAVCGYGGITVLLGDGKGGFEKIITNRWQDLYGVVVGDFNRDGKPDLAAIVRNVALVFRGNGDGTFQEPTIVNDVTTTTWTSTTIASADVNRDSLLDLIIGTTTGFCVFLGNGDGTFSPGFETENGYSSSLAIGDWNHDSILDVAVANQTLMSVDTFLGNGDGSFRNGGSLALGARPICMVTGDFNSDGRADLAVSVDYSGNNPYGIYFLPGNGDGTFRLSQLWPAGTLSMVAGDFNNDGALDIVSCDPFGFGFLSLLQGNGDGTFQPAVNYLPIAGPIYGVLGQFLAIGDFSQGKRPDLAVGFGKIAVLENVLPSGRPK